MNILTYRPSPDGRVLALAPPAQRGLVARCAALWQARRQRHLQRQAFRHALPWMAASGAIRPAIYDRGRLRRRS